MNTKYTTLIAMSGVLLLALGRAPLANAQRFIFTTIDYPNPIDHQSAFSTHLGGVANNGEVVGFFFDQAGTAHGFLRSPSGFSDPIDYVHASVAGTFLYRIDSAGETIAGYYFDSATSVQHGLVVELATNTYIPIDFLAASGVQGTLLNGINKNGEVSGGYVDSAGTEHGFTANLNCLAQTTCYQTIDFPGALETELEGVNDGGDLVGVYLSDKGRLVSFLLSGGAFTILSAPGAAVIARGINNFRHIVGFDENSIAFFASQMGLSNGLRLGSSHGFLLTSPTAQAIPVDFPGADAHFDGVGSINDSGMMAGQYSSPGFVTHGFLAVPTN